MTDFSIIINLLKEKPLPTFFLSSSSFFLLYLSPFEKVSSQKDDGYKKIDRYQALIIKEYVKRSYAKITETQGAS